MANNFLQGFAFGALTAVKKKQEQEQQKAINSILKDILQPEKGTPASPALAPFLTPPSIVNGQGQAIPGTEGQAPTFTPEELSQNPGIANTPGFIPGTPAVPSKELSALQMYQSMVNHPLFNQLQPGQAEKLIKTITGISKLLPEGITPYQRGSLDIDKERLKLEREKIDKPITDYQQETLKLQDRKLTIDEEKNRITELKNQAKDEADLKRLEIYEKNVTRLGEQLDEQIRHNQEMEASNTNDERMKETVRHNKAMEVLQRLQIEKSGSEKEKKPTWSQDQKIATARAAATQGYYSISSFMGKADEGPVTTEKEYRTYLSKMQLDPALFKEELTAFRSIDNARRQGKVIIRHPSAPEKIGAVTLVEFKKKWKALGYEVF